VVQDEIGVGTPIPCQSERRHQLESAFRASRTHVGPSEAFVFLRDRFFQRSRAATPARVSGGRESHTKTLQPLTYPGHFGTRLVSRNGSIRWYTDRVLVSTLRSTPALLKQAIAPDYC